MLVPSPIYQQDLRCVEFRIRDDAQSITPGEFRDVDAPGGNIKDAFMAFHLKSLHKLCYNLWGS